MLAPYEVRVYTFGSEHRVVHIVYVVVLLGRCGLYEEA